MSERTLDVTCQPTHAATGRGLLACSLAAMSLASSADLHAAPSVSIPFSGPVIMANARGLPALAAFADCDGQPRIFGEVRDGRYRVDLPAGGRCTVLVGERDWASQPQPVSDASKAVALAVLVYPRAVPEPALARELIEMGEQDQAFRQAWDGKPDTDFARQGLAQDEARRQKLAKIIAAKGWPAISMVGHEAANAAWLVAQHTPPEQLARARSWLALMEAADSRHEIARANLATSIDRVLVYENKAQRYGTQFTTGADGQKQPHPIDAMEGLDERRAAMGLPPFSEQLGLMRQRAGGPAARR